MGMYVHRMVNSDNSGLKNPAGPFEHRLGGGGGGAIKRNRIHQISFGLVWSPSGPFGGSGGGGSGQK